MTALFDQVRAARFTRSPWLRAFFGLVWMLAPPLHVALAEGRITGVLVHIALPWLFFTCIAAARSWAAAAVCSLLALVVAACSPSLIPALLITWVLAVLLAGRGWVRLAFTPIPALVMFLPWARNYQFGENYDALDPALGDGLTVLISRWFERVSSTLLFIGVRNPDQGVLDTNGTPIALAILCFGMMLVLFCGVFLGGSVAGKFRVPLLLA